ncbi:protein-glutamate methylesterase/protein-glutamine glutaminase [Caulobacter hibisci]|uniref:Protein-glutamate methylesterase/protein-glutamine glutaminase n=1 Tax=Caulobacter hibisci TaxID=2035993 RepID=A0ABS0T551_9CAUL|nr:chemotaxis response regulator protein-glutamate methylesterase [Caulobacter hibisci]MBI1686901.1 chemotaxis response regulator protein-glutamate methylesterase [Caulobacter hibisci]
MAKIRVLVVDDSATMRGLITAALNRDPEIEVVGAAGDPFEARGMIKALNPDVVTLDIEMPNMNGIEFLEKIMRLRPMPVVMVSSLTQAGAEMTLRALELGAVDCVGKPTTATGTAEALAEVAEKVRTAARASVRTKADAAPVTARRGNYLPSGDVVSIGSSTGGVEALLAILTQFPETCPPTVITQHMPATFTASFAARLDRASGAKVQEATDGALLEPGKVYVAPGGATHLEVVRSAGLRCRLTAGDPVSGHRPSVDVLFRSVAQAVGEKAVGAILTGMGRDGAQGLLQMRQAGARTVGQDEASCVVYGMPRAAFEIGAVEKQVSLSSIGQSILDLASARR